jgi:hypothetical protein
MHLHPAGDTQQGLPRRKCARNIARRAVASGEDHKVLIGHRRH